MRRCLLFVACRVVVCCSVCVPLLFVVCSWLSLFVVCCVLTENGFACGLLRIACCMLCVARCLLCVVRDVFDGCCFLFCRLVIVVFLVADCCSSFAVCCLCLAVCLLVACCCFGVCCLLCVVCRLLFVVGCKL